MIVTLGAADRGSNTSLRTNIDELDESAEAYCNEAAAEARER